MSQEYIAQRRIEFRDTDAGGIVHFSRFVTLMEEAEHEFLRSLGLSVAMRDGDDVISWPRVSVKCDYAKPLTFEDEIEIAVSVARLGKKSATYAFRFLHMGAEVAAGSITAVCCRMHYAAQPESIPIPTMFVDRLTHFLAASS